MSAAAEALTALAVVGLALGAGMTARRSHHRTHVIARLAGAPSGAAPASSERRAAHAGRPVVRHHRALAATAGLVSACGAIVAGLTLPYACALALTVTVLAFVIDDAVAEARGQRLDEQLADALDLMTSALQVGSGVLRALESAVAEGAAPLRPLLEHLLSQVRLGAGLGEAAAALALRVPRESYRLFAVALVVHGEAGGSLAPALSSVARAVRDRVETRRRLRTQAGPTVVSVVALVLSTAAVAWLAYRADPENVRAFLRSGAGTTMVAGSLALQAVGIGWMWRMSRVRA